MRIDGEVWLFVVKVPQIKPLMQKKTPVVTKAELAAHDAGR